MWVLFLFLNNLPIDKVTLKIISSLLLLLVTITMAAQKRLSQTYDAKGIKELYINSNEIFEIRINAAFTDQITVNTIIEGETFASTLVNSKIENGVLKITTGKTPDYIPFNDKLSAHKVMAIELEIVVPIGLDIWVYSTLASLDTYGELGQIRVDLGRGHFKGEGFRFRESAQVNTISGSVSIELEAARIEANSRNGIVTIATTINLGLPLTIETIDGDISLYKLL